MSSAGAVLDTNLDKIVLVIDDFEHIFVDHIKSIKWPTYGGLDGTSLHKFFNCIKKLDVCEKDYVIMYT